MKRLSIFFAALLVSVGSIFAAEEVYKTISFAKDNATRGNNVSSYTATWESATNGFAVSIANFNNNNWNSNWTYIKCGSNKAASVATITTKAAIDKAITKVVVTVDAVTVDSVNSTTLTMASDAAFTQDVQTITVTAAKGALPYVVTTPTKDMFYKLTYDCKQGSKNGFVQISKIEYYADAAEIPATAIALDKETITLDKGATEQLTATLTPAEATTEVVWATENAEVATVEKGLVTATGVGTTNIVATVTPAEGTTYTAKCAVTVVAAPDAPVFTVADPVFEGSMNVAITAAEGMAIYYTTDGAEPTIESTKYEAPFAITTTTTVKAIAYDANIKKASVVAEITYTKAMTCAEVNAAADKADIVLNTVTVAYVNGANIYVKDETGYTLVFKYDFGLKAGQVVKGLKGSMSIFNGLPEIVPSVTVKDLTITDGTIPDPILFTAVPTKDDLNKYLTIKGVKFDKDYKAYKSKANANVLVGEAKMVVRNNFTIDFGDLLKANTYDVTGFVAIFNGTIQLYPTEIKDVTPKSYTVTVNVNDDAMGTVTGAGEYEENATATLTATANEGYEFVNWTVGEETKTDNPLTITVAADMTITANFQEKATPIKLFTIEKMWESTDIPKAAEARQGVGYDGKVFIHEKTAKTIWAYTQENETVTKTKYIENIDATAVGIAIDNAGNMIVLDGFAGSNPSAAVIINATDKTTKKITFTLPKGKETNIGRNDYIFASGNIFSAEGGCLYLYPNAQTTIMCVKITNGAAATEDVVVSTIGTGWTAGTTASTILVDMDGNIVAQPRSADWKKWNVTENKFETISLPNAKKSTAGACTFELGGKEFYAYNVGTTNYNSEWNLYNMTDEEFVSEESLFVKDKTTTNTNIACANWLTAQKIDDKTAYIYQYCPNVGVAAWKVKYNSSTPTDIEDATVKTVAPKAVKVFHNGQVYIIRDGKTYDMMGQMVE